MKYAVEFIGASPLLMNSCRGANPLDPEKRIIGLITKKRTKTEEDHIKLMELSYKIRAYHNENIGFFIPANVIEATLACAAAKVKKKKDMISAMEVLQAEVPLICDAPKNLDEAYESRKFYDVRMVNVDRKKIPCIRPRFDRWRIKFDINIDESIISQETFSDILNYAGTVIGMCDFRPKYGRFESKITRG